MVMFQLRCGGALGAVQVFRSGYPNRLEFKTFALRYSIFLGICGANMLTNDIYEYIHRAKEIDSDEMWRIVSNKLLDIIPITVIMLTYSTSELNSVNDILSSYKISDLFTGLQLGKTQIFLHASVYDLLERLYDISLIVITVRFQRRRRNSLATQITRKYASNVILYQSWKKRSQSRLCVTATILLQRKIRVYLAVCSRKRICHNITRFKAIYRGGRSREYVRKFKYKTATMIQKNVRCFLEYKKYQHLKKCITMQQKIYRKRMAVRLKQRMIRSIINIQSVWRGTQARIKVYIYREKLVRLFSMIVIKSINPLINLTCLF